MSALLASLVGCSPPDRSGQPGALSLTESGAPAPEARATPDPTAPTGSQSLAPSASGRSMTVVQVDEGVVLRVDLDTGERSGLVVGGAPSRVARFAGQTVVSLRAERSLALLPDEGPLVELGRVRVGAQLGDEVRLIDLGAPSPTAVPLPFPTLAAPDAAPGADGAQLLSLWTAPSAARPATPARA